MATEVTDAVWRARVGLSPVERLVLLRIADRVNRHTGVAFPSVRSIADDCGLSKQGTQNILGRLIAHGYVEILEKHAGTRSRRYRMDLEKLASGQPGLPLARTEQKGLEVNGVKLVVNPMKASGQPRRPEPEEPSVEPKIRGAAAPCSPTEKKPTKPKARPLRAGLTGPAPPGTYDHLTNSGNRHVG